MSRVANVRSKVHAKFHKFLSGVDRSDQVVATSVAGEWVTSINVQVVGVVGCE